MSRADEVLGFVGLDPVARKKACTFSLGMLQRLGIARALLGDPAVLLFDEPNNGLDPAGIQWIRQLMRAFAEQGRTVLVSSHLLSEMAQTADDLIVIGDGRLMHQGPCEAFVERATAHTVQVRSPTLPRLRQALLEQRIEFTEHDNVLTVSGKSSDDIGRLAFEAGVTLHELRPSQGSLEQAFIELTGEAVRYQAAEVGR